jgi:TP901-1 family phage major tail protein
MTAIKGRNWLLKLGTAGAGGTLAGVRTTSVKYNDEEVDITTKDSAGWRTLAEAFGTQSIDIDVEGIFSDSATYETFQGYAQARTINGFYLVSTDSADTDAYSGLFQIMGFTLNQPVNGEVSFSCTLKSSGAVTFTNT